MSIYLECLHILVYKHMKYEIFKFADPMFGVCKCVCNTCNYGIHTTSIRSGNINI